MKFISFQRFPIAMILITIVALFAGMFAGCYGVWWIYDLANIIPVTVLALILWCVFKS